MKSMNWRDVVELIGISAIVASLIFVGLEMRQARDIALSELAIGYMAASDDGRRDINAHADIWARGSNGEDLSVADAIIFKNLVMSDNNRTFFASTQFAKLAPNSNFQSTYNYARRLHQNPGARAVWEAEIERNQLYIPARELPLEAGSYPARVREILDRYDNL